jgi:hypothetical protein
MISLMIESKSNSLLFAPLVCVLEVKLKYVLLQKALHEGRW